MIVVIAGPRQSGSTLLFNLVRFILEENDKISSIFSQWFDCVLTQDELIKKDSAKHHIYKIHGFDENFFKTIVCNNSIIKSSNVKIFIPLRDIRDCFSSYRTRFIINNKNDIKKFFG